MGTSTPAMAATFSDHGPAALTTRSAWISAVGAGGLVVDHCAGDETVVDEQPSHLGVGTDRGAVVHVRWRRSAAAVASRPSTHPGPAPRPSARG